MSKRHGLASKLSAVLGVAGLAITIGAPWAKAGAPVPPPWTNANYANRYVCNYASFANLVSGVAKINPNGTGGFSAGTLNAALSPFDGFSSTATPPANFCNYTLGAGSGYAVNSHGYGVQVLSWTATATNNALCPASFTQSDSLVIRNNLTKNNTVPRADLTTDNFLGLSLAPFVVLDAGHGYCLK
jgi:hypothetical protein